jgi:hypothetical protein
MGPGIPLVMAALGLIAFATSTKSAKAAPAPGTPNGAPVRPEFQTIPLPLLQEMARVMQELTVTDFATADDGSVTSATILGPITKEAVQKATSLAAKLGQAGFPNAAKTVSDLAKMASAKLPSPPAINQIPLPTQCFTQAETESLNRLVAVERDPAKLQAVLDALKTRQVPPECAAQVKVFTDMLSALIVQAQAKIDDEIAIHKTEEILKTGTTSTPGAKTSPPVVPQAGALPRVVVVQSGDGFARITKRLLGSDARWPELRDRNVPVDADGRKRSKDTAAKGGIKPQLNPGNKLFIPESWPALNSVTVNPGSSAPPFVPTIPAQPSGVTPKVTIVRSGDGFSQIAKRLIGDGSRWPELRDRNVPVDADGRKRAVDSASKGGIKPILQPNQKLFVPESWNVAPGIQVDPAAIPPSFNPASLPAGLPPTPALPASTGVRTVTVKAGDGFFRISQRLGVDGNRWHELRDRNIPVDADGRSRSKDSDGKGGIKPQLNPGNKLFVPENWPAIPAGVSGIEDDVEVGRSEAPEQLLVKTPVELTAEQMCSHLNRLLNKHPGSLDKVRNKCDKRLVARFQKLCGLPTTATVTPSTLLKAAEAGQTVIPFVLHWPEDVTAQHVSSYRMVLAKMAAEAKERGDHQAAHDLGESAKRERGQGAGLSVD